MGGIQSRPTAYDSPAPRYSSPTFQRGSSGDGDPSATAHVRMTQISTSMLNERATGSASGPRYPLDSSYQPATQTSSTHVGSDPPASYHIKRQVLPAINNLASQIIACFAVSSLPEIRAFTADDDDEIGQAYRTRRDLFKEHRRVYVKNGLLIRPESLQEYTLPQQDILRKVNKASIVLSIFENNRSSLFEVNEHYLDTFVSPGHKLLLWHGAILLELKTQAYIASLPDSYAVPSRTLDALFPDNLDGILVARHPDTPLLAPSEVDFVHRARARKQYLQAEPVQTARMVLPARYAWQDFVRSFAASIAKNVDSLLDNLPSYGQQQLSTTAIDGRPERSPSVVKNGQMRKIPGVASIASMLNADDVTSPPLVKIEPRRYPGARALLDVGEPWTISSRGADESRRRAGRAATGMALSSRQVWSSEEEDALMSGLTRVGGPYWSQILSMYGRGGSVSEVLKDRNQVQLKDKARNLKLWYLKSSGGDANRVPECLRSVTGELRKRGVKARSDSSVDNGSGGQPSRSLVRQSSSMLQPSRDGRLTSSPASQTYRTRGEEEDGVSPSLATHSGRMESPSSQYRHTCGSSGPRSLSPPARKRSKQSSE